VSKTGDPVIDQPLAQFDGRVPLRPEWFERAIAVPFETSIVEWEGAKLELLCWGDRGKPGIFLLHGNRAHAHWWSPLAAMLADRYRVAAITVSGMGKSDWRQAYSLRQHGEEAMAGARASGIFDAGSPVFVAHSYGSGAGLTIAERWGRDIAGLLFADTMLIPNQQPFSIGQALRHRIYPDAATALSRFRLAPAQRCTNFYYLDWVARHSLREVSAEEEGGPGWTWCFDPAAWDKLTEFDKWIAVTQTNLPMAFAYGGRSPYSAAEYLDPLKAHVPTGTEFEIIPDAGHHIMLDQPLAVLDFIERQASRMMRARNG
jgi:pimeloyl-ACP methyl ester carboxylesterase